MQPDLATVRVNGLDLALWTWPGDSPPIVFVHATGFHGRCWDEVIRRLPGRRAIAIELRGHGRSAKPGPPYHWRDFGLDLAELVAVLGLRGAAGVGHSMGGHSLAVAAALRSGVFASLLLIDPVIFPREYYGRPHFGDSSFIRRRRNDWDSPEEMFDRFRPRPPFSDWNESVLRDYCQWGLLPAAGRYVLACPPEIEASIYAASNAPDADIYPLLPKIPQPVTVVRGGIPWTPEEFNLASSPTAPDLAEHFPCARDILLEGRTHYIPMESPDLVAHWLS